MARLRFADISYEAGELKQALLLYEKALSQFELFPTAAEPDIDNLAMTNYQLGDDAAAIGYFEKIVAEQTTANKDAALFHLGGLYARTGKKEKSQAAYDRC